MSKEISGAVAIPFSQTLYPRRLSTSRSFITCDFCSIINSVHLTEIFQFLANTEIRGGTGMGDAIETITTTKWICMRQSYHMV